MLSFLSIARGVSEDPLEVSADRSMSLCKSFGGDGSVQPLNCRPKYQPTVGFIVNPWLSYGFF